VETSGGIEYYFYAPDGKRVWRQLANGTHQFMFYGAYGEKLGVFSDAGLTCICGILQMNVSFAGKLIWQGLRGAGATSAVLLDRTGSNRNGARFYPYGDEITSTANDREKFATYTRDSYTTFDYADQRFYASTNGRFNTADQYMAKAKGANDPATPSSWNRYAYVLGDPVNNADPQGLFVTLCDYDCFGPGGCEDVIIDGVEQPSPCDWPTGPAPVQSGLSCEMGLFYRSAVFNFLPWHHTYLADKCIDEGFSFTVIIQADPGPIPKWPKAPTTPSGYLGDPWLIGVIGPVGTGPGNSNPYNTATNHQVGGWELVPYLELVNIGNAVLNYDYNHAAPYTLFPYDKTTYNSNSFIYTLNVNFKLGFANPPGSNPGWGNYVPYLPNP